jgi:hypothetical protein
MIARSTTVRSTPWCGTTPALNATGRRRTMRASVRQRFSSQPPASFPPIEFDAFVERQLSQTLHVGTYEAAIENMLCRMADQDGGALCPAHAGTSPPAPPILGGPGACQDF